MSNSGRFIAESESLGSEFSISEFCGPISKVEILGYYKYSFTIKLYTQNCILCYTTDGDHERIYKFEPYSIKWDDHEHRIDMIEGNITIDGEYV